MNSAKKIVVALIILVWCINIWLAINIINRSSDKFRTYEEAKEKYADSCFIIKGVALMLKPNCEMEYDGLEAILPTTTIRTNSLGLRDKEYNLKKPENTTRIIMIGDSMIFGLGVEENESVPKALEKKLNEDTKNGFEVINFGVPGLSAKEELQILQELGVKFEPDIIIITYLSNDWEDDILFEEETDKFQRKISEKKCEPECDIEEFNHEIDKAYLNFERYMKIEMINKTWPAFEQKYRKMDETGKKIGAKIILGQFPDNAVWNERITYLAGELNWTIVDLKEFTGDEYVLNKYDRHLNVHGCEAVAERFEETILSVI